MTKFSLGELHGIQWARTKGLRIAAICRAFPHHTRDEIVEALNALMRCETVSDAVAYVNRVLTYQEAGLPMINGRLLGKGTAWGERPEPMFQ